MIDGERHAPPATLRESFGPGEEFVQLRVWERVRQGIREERRRHCRKAWLAAASGGIGGFAGGLWLLHALANMPFP